LYSTAWNIKRSESIYTLLFEDLVIMFGKMVQRLVEPGASFFGDVGSGFYCMIPRTPGFLR
jgi:hypothetical protein